MSAQSCPICGSFDKRMLNRERLQYSIEEVIGCNKCPTEWVVEFANPVVTDVINHED